MGKLAAIFQSKNILLAVGLIILIFLVVFLGSVIKITWLMRIGIIVFIIMVFIIVLLFRKMKQAQKAGQIEQSISTSSDSMILSPEKRAEIDQFRKQLEAAIAALKSSKLGRGKSGKAALYSLPWYMIIGPSAAGKTTAIQNSGLDFPYGKDSIKGVGGTRNCDWFFSTRAIFLDTAGRYISETEDRPEWIAFLETLKKNRKKKPINGVIIALNIDEIIKCDNNRLSEHAKNIRRRIDELLENLGVVFPVYFVFTKCDLIQGFVEFFGDFSEIERSQIWGATFSAQQLKADAKSLFETEFSKLAQVIHKARTIRLSNPLKREQRRKVYLFPYQFSTLKEKLTYLVGEVFQPNPYQDNPVFRGFYFTSGTQEGAPLDLAIREIAKQFNLPPAPGEEFDEIIETKNYFIKDLLNDVVVEDQNFAVGQAAAVVKQNQMMRMVTVAASFVLLLIMGLLMISGYGNSSEALDKISTASGSFAKLNWDGDLLYNFSQTDSLQNVIMKIEEGDLDESFIGLGLDRSERTLDAATRLYIKKTEPFFTNYIYDEIEVTLNNYASGREYSSDKIYNYLKAYLLLGNERSKLDTSNQKFLSGVITGILNSKFITSNNTASYSDKDSLRGLFRNYAVFLSEILTNAALFPARNDNSLLAVVRQRFQNKPNAESTYARLKENGLTQFPEEITFDKLIKGKSGQIMYSDFRIPYIFTSEGWKNYFKPAILDESKNPGKEDWVTGKMQERPVYQSDFDSEKMKSQLTDLYIRDYIQAWIYFLQSIKYSGFESVAYASASLKLLSDPVSSPLVLILKIFSDELRAVAQVKSSSDSSQEGLVSLSETDIMRFRKFIIGPENASAPPDMNIVIMQYGLLTGSLEGIKDGQDLIKDYAVKVMNQQAAEFPAAIKTITGAVYNVPELQNLLTEPVRMGWGSVLSDASGFINQQWKMKVTDVYNKMLAGAFPFTENGSDAPIQDFDEFFNPQNGVIWNFYNSELSTFISRGSWKINQWENAGISLSREFLNALKKADEISTILYKGGNLNLSFRLKPQLPVAKTIAGKKATVVQYYFKIDDVVETYKMGAPFETVYSWPGNTGSRAATLYITLNEFGTSNIKSYNGDWAFFRLLNDASILRGESSSQIILNWNFTKPSLYDVTVGYILNAGSSRHPFSQNFFKSFKLPSTIN